MLSTRRIFENGEMIKLEWMLPVAPVIRRCSTISIISILTISIISIHSRNPWNDPIGQASLRVFLWIRLKSQPRNRLLVTSTAILTLLINSTVIPTTLPSVRRISRTNRCIRLYHRFTHSFAHNRCPLTSWLGTRRR